MATTRTFKPYTKAEIIASLQKLPEDATIDDAIQRLYVMAKIEKGMVDIEAGRTVTQDEIERRMAEWQP
jgi:predicted transcriptional regulator